MKKLLLLLVPFLLTSFGSDNALFVGKILYHNTFADLKGNDITDKMAPFMGREQRYFIDAHHYKSYNEQNQLIQLYNSEDNHYYFVGKDKTAQLIDGSMSTSTRCVVTKLNRQEKVAGYACNALQIETDNTTTVYFYSPAIRTNPKTYARHAFGEWNKLMEATDGGLPLKFIMTDRKNGFVYTAIATEVSSQTFSTDDFKLPTDIKVKN